MEKPKTAQVQLRIRADVKKELVKQISKHGFKSITAGIGYATEKTFGVNICQPK